MGGDSGRNIEQILSTSSIQEHVRVRGVILVRLNAGKEFLPDLFGVTFL